MVADPRLQVRLRALETLQNLLCEHGALYSAQEWTVIFKGILFPMMESCKHDLSRQHISSWPAENKHVVTVDPNSWIGTMALPVLTSFLELHQLVRHRFDTTEILTTLLHIIEDCVTSDTESLVRMGLRCFQDLVVSLCTGHLAPDENHGNGSSIDDEEEEDEEEKRQKRRTTDQTAPMPVQSPTFSEAHSVRNARRPRLRQARAVVRDTRDRHGLVSNVRLPRRTVPIRSLGLAHQQNLARALPLASQQSSQGQARQVSSLRAGSRGIQWHTQSPRPPPGNVSLCPHATPNHTVGAGTDIHPYGVVTVLTCRECSCRGLSHNRHSCRSRLR